MPGQLAVNSCRATISLKITVVGGSIAGVASAYALQRAGHQVTLLEKTDGQTWSRGGLRCPPNMTKLLNQWGLGPAIDKLGHRCTQFVFQNGGTGELIAIMKLDEQFLRDLMADFVFIQHGDLHALLREEAAHKGVQFRYNTKVIDVDTEAVFVTIEDGERISSDVIIGADGFNSLVRTSVIGKQISETRGRQVTLNFTIPTSLLREDEDLKSLTEGSSWAIWLGDGYMLHGSIVDSGRDFSMALAYELPEDIPELNEEWQDTYSLEHFRLDLGKFEPRVRKLLNMAGNITPHIFVNRPDLDNFVCDGARVVLVGEAAHPLLPSGLHNTALGIEDAQTLGRLFSGIQDHNQVAQLLSAYEELRQARCQTTRDWEKRKWVLFTLAQGKRQEERDFKLRQAMAYEEWDHMDEKTFKVVWGDEMELVVYDAVEKVDDWWTKWGPLLGRGNPNTLGVSPSLQVSISREGSRFCNLQAEMGKA